VTGLFAKPIEISSAQVTEKFVSIEIAHRCNLERLSATNVDVLLSQFFDQRLKRPPASAD